MNSVKFRLSEGHLYLPARDVFIVHFPDSVEAVLDVSKLHQSHILVAAAAQDLHALHLSELFEDVFQVIVLAGLAPQ